MNRIRISANALGDHIARLYDIDSEGVYRHVDQPECWFTVTRWGEVSATVEMTPEAVQEFIADMKYQVEFMEGQYRTQCKRAVVSVMKQIAVAR